MKDKRFGIALGIIAYVCVALIIRHLLPANLLAVVGHIEKAYTSYGYGLIFLTSMLEGTFIVGMFVPGTAVILLGATLAGQGAVSLPGVIIAGASGLFCGSLLSYTGGRIGWIRLIPKFPRLHAQLVKAQTLHDQSSLITFLSFASTGIGAAIATAAGALKIPLSQFARFALITHFFWVSVWAITAFSFGALIGNTFLAFGGVIAFGIAIGMLAQWYVRKKKRKEGRRP